MIGEQVGATVERINPLDIVACMRRGSRMAEGEVNRRRLASQTGPIKPTAEKSEVVLNELTINQMRIKTCFPDINRKKKKTKGNPKRKEKIEPQEN